MLFTKISQIHNQARFGFHNKALIIAWFWLSRPLQSPVLSWDWDWLGLYNSEASLATASNLQVTGEAEKHRFLLVTTRQQIPTSATVGMAYNWTYPNSPIEFSWWPSRTQQSPISKKTCAFLDLHAPQSQLKLLLSGYTIPGWLKETWEKLP